jgi:hypothetical protein
MSRVLNHALSLSLSLSLSLFPRLHPPLRPSLCPSPCLCAWQVGVRKWLKQLETVFYSSGMAFDKVLSGESKETFTEVRGLLERGI